MSGDPAGPEADVTVCPGCGQRTSLWPDGQMYTHVIPDKRVNGGYRTCPRSPHYDPAWDPDVNPAAADAPTTKRRAR